jgi:hypothetical protein
MVLGINGFDKQIERPLNASSLVVNEKIGVNCLGNHFCTEATSELVDLCRLAQSPASFTPKCIFQPLL